MSFEKLNVILKQISSSNSYSSVRDSIEEYFSHKNIHLMPVEQEKIIHLCLRKLSDWFHQSPEQTKEIKLNFHKYFLEMSHALTRKQLIDLILNQLKETTNDYFVFLLVELYDKNYETLLDELKTQSDVSFIIRLPDRITNVCRSNIPSCFQHKHYFQRLSLYIEQQLVTFHYPNMVQQIDTNVSFLSEIIHRAAKLGYTEYIWRPLYKNLFLKKCRNDALWLRLVQKFLLETIDDILLYTIQHGNARTLDLFLSDRIVHLSSLETYLTDTLLFRKQLPIDSVRTILVYLTMSTNRIEKCFEHVFRRFLQLWSQENFIRFSSNDQHLYICQSICICLSFHKQIQFNSDIDALVMCVLNGIRIHIESTFDYIRRRGQFIGEQIIERIHLFSQSSQLQFDTYDKTHPEVLMLKRLAETNQLADDRQLSDDEEHKERNTSKKQESSVSNREQITSVTSSIVLHEASVDDDDDDADSEFEPYDHSHDTIKSDVDKPQYIRTCLAHLIATENVTRLEVALNTLPSLIEIHRIECEEVALELARILLNYNSSFNIENFEALQLNGLVTLCENYPLLISNYLCKQFYERNYTLTQRSLILKTIQETGKRLSRIDEIKTKIHEELFSSETDEEDDDDSSWRSVINKRLKLKTKYKPKVSMKKTMISKENRFGNIVGHFFYPLLSSIDKSTPHLALIDGDNDYLLLCELLACLGRLCIHAQNTPSLTKMVKELLQALRILRQHQNAGVRHAVVYAYACCLVSIGKACYDDDLTNDFYDLKQWLDFIITTDTNTEVQKLGRSVRQILLNTLQTMAEN